MAIRRSVMQPISRSASASWSAAKRHRLGVEVAARDRLARSREDQRVVGDAVRLGRRASAAAWRMHVEARAHHLRLAAQAVGVLHPRVADQVRLADRAARHQAAQASRPRPSARDGGAGAWMRGVERPVRAARRVGRERSGDQRRREQPLGLEQPGQRQRGRELGAVEQRQPLLRPEHQRLEAGLRERLGRGHDLAARSTSPTPISGSAMWASGARSPEAPTEPLHGMTGIRPQRQHRLEQRERRRPHARGALRQAGELQRHHQPHDRRPAAARRRRPRGRGRGCAGASRGRRPRCGRAASLPKPVLMP